MEFHYKFSCSGSLLLRMLKGLNLRSQAVTILKNVDILQIKLQIIANKIQCKEISHYLCKIIIHSERSNRILEELNWR